MENKEVVKEIEIEKKNTPLFILKIVGNVLFYAVIITLLLFSIMNINAGSKNGGFPNIFGRGFLSVQSNSMKRNGYLPEQYDEYEIGEFEKGDLLLVKVVNSKNIDELELGDVITYFDKDLNNLNSHRIVNINKDTSGKLISFSIQGDFSASLKGIYDPSDPSKALFNMTLEEQGDVFTFNSTNFDLIKGVVTGVNSGAGKVLENIQQNWLWYFVLPVLVFLLFEVFMVVKNIMDLKGAKQKAELANDKEAMMADLEAQKEELRRQILAEMGIQQPTQQAETPKEEAPIQVEEVKEEVQAEPEVDEEIEKEAATTDAVVVEETTAAEVEPAQEETKEEAKEEVKEEPVADTVVTENVIQTLDEPSSITEVVPQEEVQAESVEPEVQTEVVEAQEKTEEVVEPAKEVKPATKKPAAKKTTTTAKKSSTSTTKKTTTSKTSTAKKTSTSTAAKKSTTTKKTTTKKTTE